MMPRADPPSTGTHYADRLHRILGACHACGIEVMDEKVRYRNGAVEIHPVVLIHATNEVVVTPQYEKYGLHVDPRVLARLQGLGRQIALACNVSSARIEVDGDTVWVAIPLANPETLTYSAAWGLAPNPPKGVLLLGANDDGAQACLGLGGASGNVHCAVVGMTGSGKSTLMRTMILSAQMTGAQVALLDISRGFEPFSGHPSVWGQGHFADPATCAKALHYLAGQVTQRAQFGLLYVFVDEVPNLVSQAHNVADSLGVIAAQGRHSGVHLILGTQTALTGALGSATVRNITVTIMGKVRSQTAAYTDAGRAQTGAHLLRGHGDMLVVIGQEATHIQAAMIESDFVRAWAERYPPLRGTLPDFVRAQVRALVSAPTPPPEPASDGQPGRPMEEPSRRAICWCAECIRAHPQGHPPTLTRIYETTRRWYPARGGYNRDKARRTIERAQEMLHGNAAH